MTFFERYCLLCEKKNIKPMARETAKKFGVNNATIAYWGQRGNIPKGETIVLMADYFGVSADYLLCRTDNETDCVTNPPGLSDKQKQLLCLFDKADKTEQEKVVSFLEVVTISK